MSQAVASGHRLTTEAATEVLAAGGTAVDACIAAAFTTFVAEPVLAQPLGGGFLMVLPDGGEAKLLDAFVQTPRRNPGAGEMDIRTVTVDFGTTTQDFHIGAGTTGTPCLMQGLWEAHEKLGRVPMRELAAFAVRLAREGCTVTHFQHRLASVVAPILTASAPLEALYCKDGKPLAGGEVFRNPELADVLEVAAIEGPRLFSEGEVAQALVDMPGGTLEVDDLRRAAPRWRDPLSLSRGGTEIWLNPPPSLGGVQIALALGALPRGASMAQVAAAWEAINAIRRRTGINDDPAGARRILDPDLLKEVEGIIATRPLATRGTTHVSVIDGKGNGAALTLSNGEGNGLLLPGTGILPNNMLGEEDLVPHGPASWTPDRRLASMMCPTALRSAEGEVTMLGSGGSNRIRSALTTVMLGLIDRGLRLEDAISAPRLHVEKSILNFEDTGGEEMRENLLRAWPEATVFPEPSFFFGGVHAVRRARNGGADAAGDPRRAGAAAVA